ncbi:MAG: hypothetical protein J6V44_15060 [Methanobrevibacter sp.]|nr:hypothetical protein [Methanobrevibacter sp.]MBO7696549.1 hypothetical protein [Methanobrevibacter sp.]
MKMSYSDVLALLDANTLTDMIYDDRDSGRPARSLEQMVYDFARSQGIIIKEDKK